MCDVRRARWSVCKYVCRWSRRSSLIQPLNHSNGPDGHGTWRPDVSNFSWGLASIIGRGGGGGVTDGRRPAADGNGATAAPGSWKAPNDGSVARRVRAGSVPRGQLTTADCRLLDVNVDIPSLPLDNFTSPTIGYHFTIRPTPCRPWVCQCSSTLVTNRIIVQQSNELSSDVTE